MATTKTTAEMQTQAGFFAQRQITAEGWYVANPDLTVVETRRLKRLGASVDEFLDKVSS